MNEEIINKNYNGLLIVRAKNANFNAGFDGNPRTLPSGQIFATDKALKYCVREYQNLIGENVFVRRNRHIKKGKGDLNTFSYETLEQNFLNKLKILQNQNKFEEVNNEKILKEDSAEKVIEILKSFIDVRNFGVVFAQGKANISLTGPVQISYGLNKLNISNSFTSQILSPYKNKEESNQTTIGEETRADEVYYVYNISVNQKNAIETGMTNNDLKSLKETLFKSVDTITSCTKYGCENVALFWIENDKNLVFNNLDDFVDIEINKENKKIEIKVKKLINELKDYGYDESLKKEEFNQETKFNEELNKKIEVIYKKSKVEIIEE
jgi:CRISPR-associated protein Csh2